VRVRVCCPAKVNLHLEILGRRPDGYHELRTLLVAVGLWDSLEVWAAPAGVLDLSIEPPGALPAGPENLVFKAAKLLQRRFRVSQGAVMRLRKVIPVGGGLGGGSSDAAGALVALSRLWGLACGRKELLELASELGSDVPFFIYGGACWAFGRGTDLLPIADPPGWWLVLDPGAETVATAAVYGRLAAPPLGTVSSARQVSVWTPDSGWEGCDGFRNDLYEAAVEVSPSVAQRLGFLGAVSPLRALLSGSGGTVFGVFPAEHAARRARADLRGDGLIVAPVLGRAVSQLWPAFLEE
jgi:4-diphosphocytidyl-2-C-methyl-D-erythritol kinase